MMCSVSPFEFHKNHEVCDKEGPVTFGCGTCILLSVCCDDDESETPHSSTRSRS